jgi:hypothetical protein
MPTAFAAIVLTTFPLTSPAAIEQALTARSLILVSINPESRVKAERGSAAAELQQGVPSVVLVKVLNDAGVTAAVEVSGPGLGPSGWLDAQFVGRSNLKGERVEFLRLRLTPRQVGRREATFRFDIGQGTQDLGFRAEVPVLFRVRAPR